MIGEKLLFGLKLSPLYDAIAKVESDRGATSANVYQLRRIYVRDVNRLVIHPFALTDVTDKDNSENMMYVYWNHYGRRYIGITGLNPTYETLARIHNGGPDGWRKRSTIGYWNKVRRELEKNKRKEQVK